tara:strand:+ start:1464 stop:2771 length:1308 start_codon:yes stop_codon:yes gene_type:complete
MATTTLDTMLPQYARYIGAYIGSFNTTTAIGATGSLTVVISTELKDAGFTDNDALNDTFIKITSANNNDKVRRVTDYTASSGTLTVSGIDLTSDSSTQATFELYRYDPDQLRDTLNDARLEAFPELYKHVEDTTLTLEGSQHMYARPTSIRQGFVRQIYQEPRHDAKTFQNNIVSTLNCDFESSTIGDDWAATYITLAAEAETTTPDNWMVFDGSQSGKCTVTASQTATLLMTVPSGTNYVGEEINVGIWVYSKTASRVSATIVLDSTASVGSTHSGNGWERLTHTVVADGVSSSIKVGVSVTSGTAFVFYADEIIATAGQSELPKPVGTPIMGWREESDNIVLHGIRGADNMNLRVRGMAPLSSLSSGSDTMEIEGDQLRFLFAQAAMLWFQQDIDQLDDTEFQIAQRRFGHFRNMVATSKGRMAPITLLKGVY